MEDGTEESQIENAPATGAGEAGPRRLWFVRWTYGWVWIVLIVGALVTASLALVSADLASSNEQHLLGLRSKEVASVFTSALPDIETPLASAAALANLTGANPAKFTQFARTYVGLPKGEFVSMSVWRVGHLDQGPVIVVGEPPELPEAKGGVIPILRAAERRNGQQAALTVRGLLNTTERRFAYVYAGPRRGQFIVEAEEALPARYTRLPATSAYSNINAAIYVGSHATASHLLLQTVHHLPLPGANATAVIPFGTEELTVVISARQPLGGTLPERMPWVIAIVGVLLTVGAAFLTFRLIWGGRRTQALAAENRELYSEQHEIAQSLQRALLPDALPKIDGLALAALYDAGAPGVDIGGDWYDIIQLSARRLLLVVGDVSGRGIRAAAAMASVRSAIQYAAHADPPEDFLPMLSGLRSLRDQGQLATVLCIVIDLQENRVQITSAGHLPPLLVHDDGHSEFLEAEVGLPIGVDTDCSYVSSSFAVPDGASLFGFTDGLVERHGENLDDGLERLRQAAMRASGDLEQMMSQILEQVRGSESVDDTAMAGVQWVKKNNP
ncbi:MAG TPA: PP2C family protein-serine/threonine phosphatase [Solirubrobacteraceae bacterium]|nr:PP2C family protein-serine/threonine phosphatase [Solirubrobacteraceae bacterium]